MKYLLFMTTNLKTSQIFVGIHPTQNPDIFDGYLGSGVYTNQPSTFKYPKTPFQYAVKKYGADTFRRYTLMVCDTYDEAYKHKIAIPIDFYKQSHVYNTIERPLNVASPLYQFDETGKLVKTWKPYYFITDFYGYPPERFYEAAISKIQFLGYYWAFIPVINLKEHTKMKGNFKVYYLYDKRGKLLNEYYCLNDLKEYGSEEEIINAIKTQSLIKGYYISNRLMDVFAPKAKTTYSKRTYYIYTKDNEFKGKFKGKEILRALDNYSWRDIRKAIEINKGWYKNFYISFEEINQVPDRKFKSQVDVFDKFGNFIESIESIKELREKYNLSSAKLKNIQMGDKYIDNWIFRYHSK